MRFADLCSAYQAIAGTPKRLEKTARLAQLLTQTPEADLDSVLLLIHGRVFPTWDKTTIGISQKLAIKAIMLASGASEKDVIAQFKELGDLGEVATKFVGKKAQATLARNDLEVADVIKTVRKLATLEGHGSVDSKLKLIAQLLGNATPLEATFLIRILLEDLRIGIAEGTIRDAIVWWQLQREGHMYDPAANSWSGENVQERLIAWEGAVQDALDRSNDLAMVARTALKSGLAGVQKIELQLGSPTKVMLAQRSLNIAGALESVGTPAAVEYKYDGFRMQIHKAGSKITLFTRRLEEVTEQFPDVVAALAEHIKGDCLLDAEVVGYNPTTKKHSAFQEISQRIRRKYDIGQLASEFPVEVNVFDILMHGNKAVYHLPFTERRALLEKIVPNVPFVLKPSDILVTSEIAPIEKFYKHALEAGYEGLMFKALDAPYKPGSRVGSMVKLKPTLDTLDVAIVGAEWGEGKRSGWLTSFVIAIQDQEGELVEIGRVGTGFKELEQEGGVTFAQVTELLKDTIVEEHGKEVVVRPTVVLEVKCEEIQKSPSYSSGFALRFPRLVQIRSDRRMEEISTLADVLDLYEAQRGRGTAAPASEHTS